MTHQLTLPMLISETLQCCRGVPDIHRVTTTRLAVPPSAAAATIQETLSRLKGVSSSLLLKT